MAGVNSSHAQSSLTHPSHEIIYTMLSKQIRLMTSRELPDAVAETLTFSNDSNPGVY